MIDRFRRNPLFFAAVFLSAGIVLENRFPVPWSGAAAVFIPLAAIAFLAGKKRDMRMMAGVLLAAGVFLLAANDRVAPSDVRLLAGPNEIRLHGVVASDVDEKTDVYGVRHQMFLLKAESAGEAAEPKKVKGRVKVYRTNPIEEARYGDDVVIQGELALPKGRRNPGGFDEKAFLEGRGIHSIFYADSKAPMIVVARSRGNPIQAAAFRAKHVLSAALSEDFEAADGAFLRALFLGERSGLDQRFKDLFLRTGTMYILAVSGFHVGFLMMTILLLLRPFPVPKNFALVLSLAAAWFYCLLVGWQAPMVRASFMATLFVLGRLAGRKTRPLNTLGFAALVILAVNPRQLFDVGFELSFLAVAGFIICLPKFLERPRLLPNEKPTTAEKALFYFSGLFWTSFTAIFVTLPVTVSTFFIVTPLGLAANLAVVPLAFAIFFCGSIFFLTFFWMPRVLFFVPFVLKALVWLFTQWLFIFERLPGAVWTVGKPNAFFLAALIAGLGWFFFDSRFRRPAWRAAAIALFAANVFLAQGIWRELTESFSMTVLDVGQGDSIFFHFPHGGNLLIDAGKGGEADKGRWVIAPFLKSQGIDALDAVVMTHPQEDHIGGMPTVFEEFDVKNVIESGAPYGSRLAARVRELVKEEGANDLIARAGDRIEGFPDVFIDVLNPIGGGWDKNVNNDCVVLRIQYKETSFLLTGDIEGKAMQKILDSKADVRATVLKVPHHGARFDESGEAFARAVNPRYSVISVGEHNRFHHPRPETLSALGAIPGDEIYRTDRDGAVTLILGGKQPSIRRGGEDLGFNS